jgi:hypothetical protein
MWVRDLLHSQTVARKRSAAPSSSKGGGDIFAYTEIPEKIMGERKGIFSEISHPLLV